MRIPVALQNVFLQSQAGTDVECIDCPSGGVSFKAFRTKGSIKSTDTAAESRKKGHNPATARPTAMSLKIFNRLSKRMVTAADATKARLWQRKKGAKPSEDLWVPQTQIQETAPRAKKEITNPQEYLDQELATRGYSIKRYSTLQGGYHCPPNPLQLASFGNHTNSAVRTPDDPQILKNLMKVGLSPNACNKFGESIVHSVCRRGEAKLLQVLLDNSCSIQVSDDYGRTPLHDACWQSDDPCFDTVRILLAIDRDLMFLTDIRGSTPLNYVKKDNNEAWIEFLKKEMDHYWPADGVENKTRAPPLTLQEPGSQPLPGQITNLGLDVIALMATGQLSVTDPRILMAVRPAGVIPAKAAPAKPMHQDGSESTVKTEVADDSEEDNSDCDSDDSDYDSDYDSDEEYDFDDGDLDEIIMIGSQRQ